MAKGGKMAMGGETPMLRGRGPRRPQAQGRRMPQAPGRTMPQAPGSTMPQTGNKPTVLPSGATPYNVQPRAPNSDNSERISGGPQTGGPGATLRQEAHRWQDYDDTPIERDPRKAFSLTGMQAAYEKSQQPGGGGFDPRTYGSGPRTGGPGATLQQGGGQQPGGGGVDPRTYERSQQMMAKGGSIKAKKGGSVKSKSASSRGDGCAQRGKTRGKMV